MTCLRCDGIDKGGRHYSDSPHSAVRTTQYIFSMLRHIEIVETGGNWRGSRRYIHRKHGIDRGTEVTEGSAGPWGRYPSGVWGAPVPPPRKRMEFFPWNGTFRCIWIYSGIYMEKLQHTSNTNVLPLIFGIWFGVFPIGTARTAHTRPIQLYSPDVPTQTVDCRNSVCRNSVVYPNSSIWITLFGTRPTRT